MLSHPRSFSRRTSLRYRQIATAAHDSASVQGAQLAVSLPGLLGQSQRAATGFFFSRERSALNRDRPAAFPHRPSVVPTSLDASASADCQYSTPLMVSVGSKALLLREHKARNLTVDSSMAGEDTNRKRVRKNTMSRKPTKTRNFVGGDRVQSSSGGFTNLASEVQKSSKPQNASMAETSFVRKQVDPETAKYFLEIANVIEGNEIDSEERSVICGNALEETRGKEVQLATDYIISHTLQILLEGCSVDHLCSFLRCCAKDFPHIAMDRSGSHVVETAFKALATYLEDSQNLSLIQDTLKTICQAIAANPVSLMCNCHGSHVLRSLLCLCKGVPLDSSEFHSSKRSLILAERMNTVPSSLDLNFKKGRFADLLKLLVFSMVDAAKEDMESFMVDQYSSLVLQIALKLLAGHEQELLHIIPILLCCNIDNTVEGNIIDANKISILLNLMKESAYSHLMEVILEVAPQTVYDELFSKVLRNSLFELSSHYCGNFVVQALFSHARSQHHMDVIWEELGTKFRVLLEMGKSGVIASLIAACQRLHSHEHKCCLALAAAVCLGDESSRCIVPRILFLDNYFTCGDKSNWNWPTGVKMHVIGSLILQSVFRFSTELIQSYITSIISLEAAQVLEASKDAAGARVIEAFFTSKASGKQKHKLTVKLRGHFGELALQKSGSFTVEKCFSASNMTMKQTIVSELLDAQTQLSKTKQGPYLLRKLDVDGYARNSEEWKSRQTSKQSAFNDFHATFGSNKMKSSKSAGFLTDTVFTSQPKKLKEVRNEIDTCLASATATATPSLPFLAHKSSTQLKTSGTKRRAPERDNQHGEKFFKSHIDNDVLKAKSRKHKQKLI